MAKDIYANVCKFILMNKIENEEKWEKLFLTHKLYLLEKNTHEVGANMTT